jgi:hypothetical protein
VLPNEHTHAAIPNLDGIVGARQAGALLSEQNKSSSGLPRPYTKVIFGITAPMSVIVNAGQITTKIQTFIAL